MVASVLHTVNSAVLMCPDRICYCTREAKTNIWSYFYIYQTSVKVITW